MNEETYISHDRQRELTPHRHIILGIIDATDDEPCFTFETPIEIEGMLARPNVYVTFTIVDCHDKNNGNDGVTFHYQSSPFDVSET